MGEGGQVRRHQGGLIWSCEGPLLLLPACGEKVGMRGRGRCLSVGRGLRRQRFIRDAQNRGEAPSPSLRSTSPRTRGEVFFRHCEERSDEAIQRASRPSQAALDCFAALAMMSFIPLALRFLFAPRALFTNGTKALPQTKGRRSAERRVVRDRDCAQAERRLSLRLSRRAPLLADALASRRSTAALARFSGLTQSGPALHGSGDVCATRAASSWQTCVVAGRARFRTARTWLAKPRPGTALAPLFRSHPESALR